MVMVTRDRQLSRPCLLFVVFLRLCSSVCKDLATTQVTSDNKYQVPTKGTAESKDQVATKGTRPLRPEIFSDIYGCPSYHKTGESYYNSRQLGITNCVDRQLLQNAATLITKCVVRFYYKMPQPLLQNA